FAFLDELRAVSAPAAETDMAELQRFAAEQGAAEADDLQHWDVAFWAERLRETHYGVNEEELRPYFPLPTVLAGLFALTKRLFGAEVEPADGEAPVWHEDVRVFKVLDETGERRATFYLDPYSRPADKRGGAWVNPAVSRSRVMAPSGQSVRLPAAYVCCNQAPPVDGQPSLMSFREVETLFHEFGHALQALLTTVDYGLASGLNLIEWDAVEIASQFMENWCYQRRTMDRISGHVETGEPLPDELFEKLTAARTYRSGSLMMRQLQFGLIDMDLHTRFDPDAGSPLAVQKRFAKTMNVLPPLPEDRFICAFTHLFAGGYAAGYYSYKWSEVLSADAFGAFEEAGLGDEQAIAAVGRRYRDTILALGGSRPPMEVFVDFRGREPSTEALLRHAGLAG
ncbi:MAG TPA: M3 family metallopeptidase, partial [Limnochordia bacterium]|nr:M3 family metallopeptidase [Limnochordia bacterium]